MYIIRETFTAKPGQASKLAKLFTEMSKAAPTPGTKSRVLTDFIGAYNTVIWEMEVKDLAEFEKTMKEYGEKPEIGKMMTGYTEMYQSGKREIFRVVG